MSSEKLRDASWDQVTPERENPIEVWSRRIVLGTILFGCVGWFFLWILPRHESLLNSM